ncbi:MAG TPA: cbb3-type cytochrome c oxidase N-terminal domain-containing protein, partial [Bacteroidia bacterium]|nr:cbb3-type cytochrome c oxidase N-terminal domain-containing protein [Bacteroidia bacterium]
MFKNTPGKVLMMLAAMFAGADLSAQQAANKPDSHSLYSNGVFDVMLCIIILLLLVIIGFAEVVKAGAAQQKLRDNKEKNSGKGTFIAILFIFITAGSLWAQDNSAPKTIAKVVSDAPFDYWGMGAITFYCMLMVIAIELLIAFVLFRTGMGLLNVPEKNAERKNKMREEGIMESKLMKSLTDAVPIEEESAILMDHDYDGIRELDNNLPPWWKYGFYVTIVVAVIYLLHFHVFHTGKLSIEEYNQELKDGEAQVAEYKKTARDIVDETTVTKLTDATSLSEGHAIFKANCVPCHGEFGEGKEGLGPNFTDDYWLHGGSIQSVFKSIKYGWTDKGMKSWQQDLKPNEIQL